MRVEKKREEVVIISKTRRENMELRRPTPAGYDLTPVIPAFFASLIVSGVILGCKYKDIRNWTFGSIF